MPSQEALFKIDGHELKLSNLDKVLYPETGFTKGHVIDYYARIAPVLLPHLKDRPLTLKRYPNGVDGMFFYEKRAPKHRPAWLKTARVASERDETGKIDYCLANDLASLVWAANLADLELHTFLARRQDVERPTQVVFDLDPGAPADAVDCAQVALWLRELLAALKLRCWIKSSGSKGLQLHIPLNTAVTYETTKPFAKAVAMALQRAHPNRVVYDQKKAIRGGKVLIDWSQNDSSKTTVCVYSLRAKAHPFVAAPLMWKEVEACLKKKDARRVFFDSKDVLKRVEKQGDLFAEVLTLKQKLPAKVLKLLESWNESTAMPSFASARPKKKSSVVSIPASRPAVELKTYQAKRDFAQTREPSGKVVKEPTSAAALFVIQKHDASRLHYDFRLAMGGVLKSWAVPKGVPTQKGEKHLAVEVEDHPMDYARFEGIIPAGNYGGGTVMVWDIGEYRMLGGQPLEAWREGLLHLELKGKKLNGEWSLIRTRQERGKNQWLLLKSGQDTRPISARSDDQSALSHRSMAQIAKAKDATWDSSGPAHGHSSKSSPAPDVKKKSLAIVAPKPVEEPTFPSKTHRQLARRFVEPMKCLPVKEVPVGARWLYELKFDGYRALAVCGEGVAVLLSRNRKEFNRRFPAVVEALGRLPVREAVLDGEIVALDEKQRPSFQALQNYESGPLAYYLFDLLSLDGEDWTARPLAERRARLQKLLAKAGAPLLFSGNLPGKAETIWREIVRNGCEGVIAKRTDSEYEVGRRSGAWVKVKAVQQQEFVIGGFTPPRGSRHGFGALLIGVYEGKKLRFCCKVGTGFDRDRIASLLAQMKKIKTGKCPFFNLPVARHSRWGGGIVASEMASCTWIEPKLVCEVQFTEWTGDSSLRHPAFLALREDVAPEEVHRETPVEQV